MRAPNSEEDSLSSHEKKKDKQDQEDTDLDKVEWTLDAKLKVTLDNGTQDKMILVPFKPGLDAMIFLVLIVAPF